MIEELKFELPLSNTKSSILNNLLERDMTAIELEEKLGINESAIRRHLDGLEQKNYVEHYFKKADRGRPKKFYRIDEKGRSLFPNKNDVLLSYLLETIKEEFGEENLEKILSKTAEKLADRLSSEEGEFESRLREFVGSLNRFGFYASLSKTDGEYVIEYRNCVFRHIGEEDDDHLCTMHREIVEKALPETNVEAEKGEEVNSSCLHRIEVKDKE